MRKEGKKEEEEGERKNKEHTLLKKKTQKITSLLSELYNYAT